MAAKALYNKWRSQTFDQIIGQEHITRTLRNQIRAGRIGHAYLFTGLRGTGKTSTARILAKAVNCVGDTDDPPCNECHICKSITAGTSLDLIEIDAASNRGIDEIRELRDRVNFVPHECRYKVYVIDEVHMLTREAFNALLKTLEEPPDHVIFILCTTEPTKLPDTILSRCQRFDFRRGSVEAVLTKLEYICEHEELDVSEPALEFIARRASGSFRDAESLLDQLAAYGAAEITVELVRNVLGTVSASLVIELISQLVRADAPGGLHTIDSAIQSGAEPRQFLSEIVDHLRAALLLLIGSHVGLDQITPGALEDLQALLDSEPVPVRLLVRAIRLFNDASQSLRGAARPQLPIELAFVETLLQEGDGELPEPSPTAARQGVEGRQEEETPPATSPTSPSSEGGAKEAAPANGPAAEPGAGASQETSPEASASSEVPAGRRIRETTHQGEPEGDRDSEPQLTLDWVRGNWNTIVMKMGSQSRQLQAVLRSVYPSRVRGNVVTLACEGTFHRDTLSDSKRLAMVEGVARGVLGADCSFECALDSQGAKGPPGNAGAQPADRGLFSKGENDASVKIGAKRSDSRKRHEAGSSEKSDLLAHPAVRALEKRGGKARLIEDREGGSFDG